MIKLGKLRVKIFYNQSFFLTIRSPIGHFFVFVFRQHYNLTDKQILDEIIIPEKYDYRMRPEGLFIYFTCGVCVLKC